MNKKKLKKEIFDLVKKITKSKSIKEKTNLFKKNLIDSLSIINLISSLEKKYKIKINISMIQTKDIESINKIIALVIKLKN